MKYLVASILVFASLSLLAIVITNSRNYFGTTFESTSFWLLENNPNVADIKTFERFTRVIDLYDFIRDDSGFVTLQYMDENLDFHSITLTDSIVGKSIYSVSKINGESSIKLLTRGEAIKAIAEWRTEYTFEVQRELGINTYFVSAVYINEPE